MAAGSCRHQTLSLRLVRFGRIQANTFLCRSKGMTINKLKMLALGFGLSAAQSAFAGSSIPCGHALEGDWLFGVAPVACAIDAKLASPASVQSQYGPVIYDDRHPDRTKFMSALYPYLRDTASNYIHRRNPKVSAAEEDAFLHAVYALANQESYWSHYRLGKDGILRFMRGDSGHGFGMMQMDDRSHLAAIRQGKGQDLASLVLMGLDIFYPAWVKSASVRCVGSSGDYHNRARAAWSAYNGGPGQICRWASAGSAYHRFDVDFNNRYNAQAWKEFVRDTRAKSSINAKCLAEGVRPCALTHGD